MSRAALGLFWATEWTRDKCGPHLETWPLGSSCLGKPFPGKATWCGAEGWKAVFVNVFSQFHNFSSDFLCSVRFILYQSNWTGCFYRWHVCLRMEGVAVVTKNDSFWTQNRQESTELCLCGESMWLRLKMTESGGLWCHHLTITHQKGTFWLFVFIIKGTWTFLRIGTA